MSAHNGKSEKKREKGRPSLWGECGSGSILSKGGQKKKKKRREGGGMSHLHDIGAELLVLTQTRLNPK